MSQRLQVVFEDEELEAIREMARRQHTTVAEWVRRSLREARRAESAGDPEAKLAAIRTAVKYDFPSADIDVMLGEIERGYGFEGDE